MAGYTFCLFFTVCAGAAAASPLQEALGRISHSSRAMKADDDTITTSNPLGLPETEISCSLNGRLSTSGVCICRHAWKGQNCSELVLQPATVAFKLEGMVAWGAAIQQDTDGSWHAFVAVYEGGLGNWDPNSHIVHAIADKGVGPAGPYKLAAESAVKSTVVGKYHASPAILKVDGIYYLFTTGTSWNSTAPVKGPEYCQLVVSVAHSLNGPWNTTTHQNAFGNLGSVLNVGVIQLPDGRFALSGDTHSSNGESIAHNFVHHVPPYVSCRV